MEAASDDFDTVPLKALSRAFQLYREHVPSSSVLQFYTFLEVALQDGPITLTELAQAVGTVKPVISAAIGNLGPHGRGTYGARSTPPNLIHCAVDPSDARRKLASLTPKGAELAARMGALIEGAAEGVSCIPAS